MTLAPDIPVLAIDGGGTRCRFVLLARGQRFEAADGPANVSSDFEGAAACLERGIREVAGKANLPAGAVLAFPAHLGVAGVTGPEIAERLRGALGLTNAVIADDRPAALRGALGPAEGVLAHCGTGSFFAARLDGTTRFSGGWGWILGDEASAQWVGRRLLALTLRHVDGHLAGSEATGAVLDRFGGSAEIVRFAGTADPAAFGTFAPLVSEAAASGDPVALAIMQDAARDVAGNLGRIGWTPGTTICLTGGIGPHFEPYLPDAMRDAIRPPRAEPIEGALALARDLAGARGE